jgi:hypothetical protein
VYGVVSWCDVVKREVQHGVFMLLCLRCPPDACEPLQQQQAVRAKLQHPKLAAKVRSKTPLLVTCPYAGHHGGHRRW